MAPWRPSSCTRRPAEFHSAVACCGTIGLLPQRSTASQGAPWNPQSHTLVKPRSVPGQLELVENEIRASPNLVLNLLNVLWNILDPIRILLFCRIHPTSSSRHQHPAMASSMSSCLLRAFNVAHGPNHAQPVPRGLHLPGMEHMENIWKTMRFEMFMIFRGRDKLSRTVSLFFDLL